MNNLRFKSKIASILALFFLSPFVGEYLLGNLPITFLFALPFQATLYGGGCLLIREISCRMKSVWPSRILLCIAYALIEEVFVAQTIFNQNYFGLNLLKYGYLSFLGTGAWWVVFVLSIHTIWSTSVPIALTECLYSKNKKTPWMNLTGIIITAFIFFGGCTFLSFQLYHGRLHGSKIQIFSSIIIIISLVVLAYAVGKHEFKEKKVGGKLVPAYVLGITIFVISFIYLYLSHLQSKLSAGLNILFMILLIFVGAFIILRLSRHLEWKNKHTLAVVSGLIFTYSCFSFIQPPTMPGVTYTIKYTGNFIFFLIALFILTLTWLRDKKANLNDT